MLNSKQRIEDLEKSAADFGLLALLSLDTIKRQVSWSFARHLRLEAEKISGTPPDDTTPPIGQAVRPRPLSLAPVFAAFAQAA